MRTTKEIEAHVRILENALAEAKAALAIASKESSRIHIGVIAGQPLLTKEVGVTTLSPDIMETVEEFLNEAQAFHLVGAILIWIDDDHSSPIRAHVTEHRSLQVTPF